MQQKDKLLKYLSFGGFAIIIILLAIATVLEKTHGSEFVATHIYGAFPTIGLWMVATLSSLLYLLHRKTYRKTVTFSLHLSFFFILTGALITHLYGEQGKIHLKQGEKPIREFKLSDEQTAELPFVVSLKEFQLKYYEGTFAPMDYVSTIIIEDEERHEGTVSMNNIHTYRGYRFYQSGYGRNGEEVILAISHDPWGIGVTYAGYLCLLLTLIAFFFQRESEFRKLLKHPALRKGGLLLLLIIGNSYTLSAATHTPRTLPKEIAEEFGNLYIYYNDRICPLQTLANDFTTKLYGKSDYKGLSAEQVLTGWFFFYDDWKHEPMIKIKSSEVQQALNLSNKFAALKDFTDVTGYKLEDLLRYAKAPVRKKANEANEKFNLVSMLCTGTLLKIYPVNNTTTGETVWYSLTDRLPENLSYEQSAFIRGSMNLIAEKVAMKEYKEITSLLEKIRQYQLKEAKECMPGENRFLAEKLYNRTHCIRPLAMASLTLGIICFLLFCLRVPICQNKRFLGVINLLLIAMSLYLTIQIALRWYISNHIPLSNGFETMLFMAWCSAILTLLLKQRFKMSLPFGWLLCGFTLLVAGIGESSPQITQLMPVLQSPFLSIHVMVIMVAYTLLAFTMLNGMTALILHYSRKESAEEVEYLYIISRLLLYPAVFLLAIGIFIGAVWANVSWGRYWGWDPKEVWALITMLVYAAALHTQSLKFFRQPMFFHKFCVVAFLTVLITYFGVNFLLGGMHSYANM